MFNISAPTRITIREGVCTCVCGVCVFVCVWPAADAPPAEIALHPVRNVHLHCQNLQTLPSVNSQDLYPYRQAYNTNHTHTHRHTHVPSFNANAISCINRTYREKAQATAQKHIGASETTELITVQLMVLNINNGVIIVWQCVKVTNTIIKQSLDWICSVLKKKKKGKKVIVWPKKCYFYASGLVCIKQSLNTSAGRTHEPNPSTQKHKTFSPSTQTLGKVTSLGVYPVARPVVLCASPPQRNCYMLLSKQ